MLSEFTETFFKPFFLFVFNRLYKEAYIVLLYSLPPCSIKTYAALWQKVKNHLLQNLK